MLHVQGERADAYKMYVGRKETNMKDLGVDGSIKLNETGDVRINVIDARSCNHCCHEK